MYQGRIHRHEAEITPLFYSLIKPIIPYVNVYQPNKTEIFSTTRSIMQIEVTRFMSMSLDIQGIMSGYCSNTMVIMQLVSGQGPFSLPLFEKGESGDKLETR